MALDDIPDSVAAELDAYEAWQSTEIEKLRFLQHAHRLGRDAGPIMVALLEERRLCAPQVAETYFLDLNREAKDWADWSDPGVLQAYACAALTRLERAPALGLLTRKRLFAAIWQSFGPEDRAAFLAKVDPKERKKI